MIFAAVADDDTGASDLGGMFADQGVPTVLVLDASGDLSELVRGAECVIFATATRALSPREAYAKTADAARSAVALGPRSIEIKYCSTFDSTREGNIGPSIDAAMDVLSEKFTIAFPALPVNGRTTYQGYHFVKGQLISDSPMRQHPLTPMTNPNLVEHLQAQTRRRVWLTPWEVVDGGSGALRHHWSSAGEGVSVVDCLCDRDAEAICEAAADLRLVTGGSAFGRFLPGAWRRRGWLGEYREVRLPKCEAGRGRLVVAGSCSTATAAQNAWLARQEGVRVLEYDAQELVDGVRPPLAELLKEDRTVLFKTRSSREDVARAQAWGATQGWSARELGLRLAEAMAGAVRHALDEVTPRALVSAGGETSSALCRALAARALCVGRNIQPGVPLCVPVEGRRFPLVLKSGNFGSEDFYGRAFAAAGQQ
ncbi:MAG: four-carbon acid sugar kinase family protein [Bryobacteraceae bacterium]|nr:four-carbon acid sugar kinase family protein [Bryobacteraceae bacterium]